MPKHEDEAEAPQARNPIAITFGESASVTFLRIIVRIAVDQTVKTFNRPSRIVLIPLNILLTVFHRPILWTTVLLANNAERLPKRWLNDISKMAINRMNFENGAALLNDNKPEEAWTFLRRSLKFSEDPYHYFVGGVCLLVGLGRFERAMQVFAQGNALRQKKAARLGVDRRKVRFLDPIWVGAFGHLAQLDYLLKLNILEGRASKDTILYIPPNTPVVNRCLLDLWRPFLNVVENEADLPMPLEKLTALTFDYLAPQLPDGSTVYMWELAGKTYRRWFDEKRAPLLTLPSDIAEKGRAVLREARMPADAWFVVLHVREKSSKKNHVELHNVLNASIEDYIPAIQEITKRGGWVVRMGDPSMRPLPEMERVFDYCHSKVRTDWMDIFLCASATFFVGTSSGPSYVPLIFGVPSVLTNWWPPAQRPLPPHDIYVPKWYRRISDNKRLSLTETLREPFCICNSMDYLSKAKGVVVEDNSPEDIRLATLEMFEQIEGMVCETEDDVILQKNADRIYEGANVLGLGKLSRSFARANRSLIV